MKDKRLATIFGIVFVDLLGFSIVLPLIPFYAKDYGANDFVAGLLVASYALAQLIGAPLLGRMSDRYGRRPVLLISIAGTILGFVLLGVAGGLFMLFVSRIVDGLTGGNISVAQAYIVDITDQKSRAQALGIIGAAFGLGFIIGPVLGGVLSNVGEGITAGGLTWQYALPAFAAAGLATINWIAVYLFLPESLSAERREELAKNPRAEFTLRNLAAAFQRPRVGPLLHTRFWFGLAFAMFQTVFALYAASRLGLAADQTAFILAYVGVLVVLVQGVLVGRLAARFPENRLVFWCSAIMSASLLAWAATPSVPVLLIVLIPLAFAGGTLNTVINSLLSKSVYPEEVGGTLGISASVESATRVLAPVMGGALLNFVGPWAPGVAGALLMAWLTTFVWRRLVVNPDPPLPPRGVPAPEAMPAAVPVEAH